MATAKKSAKRGPTEQEKTDNPAGFITLVSADAPPRLMYRPQPGETAEPVLPWPERNITSYVHKPTGAYIDLNVQTPIASDFAGPDDVADPAPADTSNADTGGEKKPVFPPAH